MQNSGSHTLSSSKEFQKYVITSKYSVLIHMQYVLRASKAAQVVKNLLPMQET